jgi:hypothetical protein
MPMAMTPEHSVKLQGVWEKWQLEGGFVEMNANGTSWKTCDLYTDTRMSDPLTWGGLGPLLDPCIYGDSEHTGDVCWMRFC